MDQPDATVHRTDRIQRWLFWVLILGLVGTETELLLLEHYEDPWQFVPLVLIACAMAVLALHRRRPDGVSLRAWKGLMLLFLVSGVMGLALHFRGAAEFQLELEPAMGRWDLVAKVMRTKAPPVLAPGVMLQLGLIGLAYAAAAREKTGERASALGSERP
jgi:hypothetical protein